MRFFSLKRLAAPLVLLAGAGISFVLAAREHDALPPAAVKLPPAVAVTAAEIGDVRLEIPAWGLVAPREHIDIHAQVSGRIVRLADGLAAGAVVKQREVLFALDARDYQNRLDEAEADVEQAVQALEIEKGRQKIARAEYLLLKESLNGETRDSALALRIPQLKEREAVLKSAVARRNQARLDLERTLLRSPCTGRIMEENLAVGHFMEAGAGGMSVACTDTYHIMALFSPEYVVDEGESQVLVNEVNENRVHVNQVRVNIDGREYPGQLKTVLPQIDADTRQKQALVAVAGEGISVGAYASVTLPGQLFRQVAALPVAALRAGDTVWVMTAQARLEIRNIRVAAKNRDTVLVRSGVSKTDRVILSHLSSPINGMALRVKEEAGS